MFWLTVEGPVHSHLRLNAVRVQKLAICENTPDRKSCCLRETVYIETDQWTVLQKQLRRKKKQPFKVWGQDQLDGQIVLCGWKSSHVMSSVVLNRLEAPVTVQSQSFKNTTLVPRWCCIAVQFCFYQLRGLHSVHITLKDWLIPQAAGCLTCRATWEHGDDIKTENGRLLFTDMAFECW